MRFLGEKRGENDRNVGDEGSMEIGALMERLGQLETHMKTAHKGRELHVLAVQDNRGLM